MVPVTEREKMEANWAQTAKRRANYSVIGDQSPLKGEVPIAVLLAIVQKESNLGK